MNKINKLNFGCGNNIRKEYINADIKVDKNIDISFDFNCFPYPIKTNTFDEIFSDNVIEHLDNIPMVMKELHRISKPNGIIKIIVPYYNSYGAYNDVTHLHFFNEFSFSPFYEKNTRSNYFIDEEFRLIKLMLVPTRFGKLLYSDSIRKPLSKVIGQIFQTIEITLSVIK